MCPCALAGAACHNMAGACVDKYKGELGRALLIYAFETFSNNSFRSRLVFVTSIMNCGHDVPLSWNTLNTFNRHWTSRRVLAERLGPRQV